MLCIKKLPGCCNFFLQSFFFYISVSFVVQFIHHYLIVVFICSDVQVMWVSWWKLCKISAQSRSHITFTTHTIMVTIQNRNASASPLLLTNSARRHFTRLERLPFVMNFQKITNVYIQNVTIFAYIASHAMAKLICLESMP